MDLQERLYKEKHKNDPGNPNSMNHFNNGIKGMMVGVVFAIIYSSYRPYDFLLNYIDAYFELFLVICAILGYIVGWTISVMFSVGE